MYDASVRLILLSHAGATWYMTGLIWFVQVVHYPLFRGVGSSDFAMYEQRHTGLTSWVVGPPMLIEGATAVSLFWLCPSGIPTWQVWLGVALLAVVWLSTALVQVPCHNLLSKGFDVAVHERLVATNWVRTIAWSSRGLLVLWMAWSAWR